MKHTSWETQIISREDLPENALLETFNPDRAFAEAALLEALNLVARECEIPIGKLRPLDKFEEIFKRLTTYNPVLWFFMENKIPHHQENLEFALWGRMKKLGMPKNAKTIITVKDYVMLWCGKQL